MEEKPLLGIIGGSGLYEIEGLEDVEQRTIETSFGRPSSPLMLGKLAGNPIAFIARHGIGHHISPSEVNYRANIMALKMLGVAYVVSVSACGSLREDFAPGDIVIPNQVFDNTKVRARSFFGEGLVAHISVADPFCPSLSDLMAEGLAAMNARYHAGGNYITIEGPRFSTRAESNTYRAWGMSIIGMTTCPEVFLAREAEMCYAVMAHVTDYDVWHISEEPVSVEMVLRTLQANTELAKRAIKYMAAHLPESRTCACQHALRDALITRADVVPDATRRKLGPLIERYLS
jgi:5'-methylthioadenosine phosphorylase